MAKLPWYMSNKKNMIVSQYHVQKHINTMVFSSTYFKKYIIVHKFQHHFKVPQYYNLIASLYHDAATVLFVLLFVRGKLPQFYHGFSDIYNDRTMVHQFHNHGIFQSTILLLPKNIQDMCHVNAMLYHFQYHGIFQTTTVLPSVLYKVLQYCHSNFLMIFQGT